MFPIRDDNPQILTPYATVGIVLLNVFAWSFVQGLGNEPGLSASVCNFGLIPGELLQQVTTTRSICVIGDTTWYTTVTSMFMHGGWMHLLGNMWFLWIFGNNVEDAMGSWRFVCFYLLCGLAAAAAQVAADPASNIPMVGASGAIGGVMGAYILLYPRVRVHMLFILVVYVTTFAVPAWLMLGYWLLLQIVSGIATFGAKGGGVAFWAHIGGFVGGSILIYLFRDNALLAKHPYHGWTLSHPATQSWRRIRRRK